MNCPKCSDGMEKVSQGGIEVDRCRGCGGIWFDLLEREKLAAQRGSARIDTGDPDTGEEFDEVDRVDCPVCHTRMIRMVDADQPHVRYGACKVCNGVFLDAGEFTDYKKETWLDFFKGLISKERR